MDTFVTMQGNLVAEPTQKVVASGARVTHFRIASNRRRFDKALNDWVDGPTTFMSVSCWRQLGDNVYKCLHKGDTVVVHGRLTYREFDDADGKRRSSVEVEATNVGPDLGRYVVLLSRPNRELEAEESTPAADAVPAQPTDGETNPWTEPVPVSGEEAA